MKLSGYERIDSDREGKSTHGYMLHRQIPLTRAGSKGYKTSYLYVSDDLLAANGLSGSQIVDGFAQDKDFIIETVQQGNYTSVVSILIL